MVQVVHRLQQLEDWADTVTRDVVVKLTGSSPDTILDAFGGVALVWHPDLSK